GLTLGVLDAVTAREVGAGDSTIEPLTNYVAARVQQDFFEGRSRIGLMLTGVHPRLDAATSPFLHRTALASMLEALHQSADRHYPFLGYFGLTDVEGSAAAIARTQRTIVHDFQRPDAVHRYDSTRTRLTGDAEGLLVGKTGGGITRWQVHVQHFSPGFESNDL